ncbi:hypothetical protein falkor_117 [Salmonella phage falkor]|uniref:Uncharacterized protein n=6 Tax=Epseptimavirus TaxID=2732017 RepID=A0A6G9L7B7_9CAUD|nr:hypothetical protein HWD23_gp149 [Salmonella phage faergetype]YP_009858824.1 hypothetical protein HWD27_gp151 [Salmonella phage oselot]QIO00220.1 hypothetical protein beppo_116 [Salmonella phage beppo]QIO00386.1 hypothetical protein polluks_116 [Salmonella phage polluks]QIO01932.1 hypothetical protein falkor_117 [Salmonella phage falkor]QIO01593.1 hypothetical protein oselot_116 [Salmonella phage oselot]QIQ61465.1 hypothetical protein faergetype_108 [Salmonella phage faergetype]
MIIWFYLMKQKVKQYNVFSADFTIGMFLAGLCEFLFEAFLIGSLLLG